MIYKHKINLHVLVFTLILLNFTHITKCEDPPRISGKLNMFGKWMKTQKQNNIMAFLGIPYAEPPIGDLRFADPKPLQKLKDDFNATVDSDFCPQKPRTNKTLPMSEDCLKLNVYTRNKDALQPVLVFIHGGAFVFGGGQSYSYGPQYLLDNDLVLVTINYRLGPFGFLSTKTKDATGNYGLKDQVLALKWIRDNIKEFGGDPNSVTIFGQSAGGWSVSAHLVSPLSKGLFHKAIAFSGSTTSAYHIDNLKWTTILAKKVNCSNDNPTEMVKCLRNVPWKVLADNAEFKEEKNYLINFNIEIEEDFGQERFLVEHPSITVMNGSFHKVPIMTGTTRDEFDQLAHDLVLTPYFEKINENFEAAAPLLFTFQEKTKKSSEIAKKIKEFYFKQKAISTLNLDKLSQAFSDSSIIHSVHRLVHLAKNFTDIYYYRFDYKSRFSCGNKDWQNFPKFISHTDDLQYIFVSSCGPPYNVTDPEQFMVERLNKWIYNFVKTGNPNDIKDVDPHCGSWPKTHKENVTTLFNGRECSVREEPYLERMKLWDELFPVGSKAFRFDSLNFAVLVGLSFVISSLINGLK
ncbi:juvenile hormone esterase-like [Condylostylus longicornis]|uniref:juvenile hormone esterase-like n=1 Tax=Condylostylus longicornis TaxID=2530218 RepID=UPI00244E2229|nr:juvenile hormone esterase-like [Condylostylus longicornis]